MPDSQDYRDMVSLRFNDLTTLMNAHFQTVNVTLDSIKKDTALTNGRVSHAESEIEKLEDKVDKAISYGNHVIESRVTECPNLKRFEKSEDRMEKLEKKLEDIFFVLRYPKLFLSVLVFFVVVSLWTIYETVHEKVIFRDVRYEMNSTKIESQKINDKINDIQTRGVTLKKDSLNGTNTH